jgi:hypothetical protein
MQRKVLLLSRNIAVESVQSHCLRTGERSKELVRDPDIAAVYVGCNGLSAGSAVAEEIAEGVGQADVVPGEVCVCCGTWWLIDEEAPLPCGSAWPNRVDRTGHSEDVAWRIFRGNTGRLWGCPECGAVFEQSRELRREGIALSLLAGVRVSGAWSDRWSDKSGGGYGCAVFTRSR